MSTRGLRERSGRRSRAVAVLIAGLVLTGLAACGGDDSGSGGSAAGKAKAGGCEFPDGKVRAFATLDLSGIAGDLGPSIKRAYDAWIPHLNAQGGILGCDLEVDFQQEQFPQADQCLRSYREAVASEKYQFMFGAFGSACNVAVPSLTVRGNLPVVFNASMDHQPFLEDFSPGSNAFIAGPSLFHEARASARFMEEQGWSAVGMLNPNFVYGQQVGDVFEKYHVDKAGGTIVEKQLPAPLEKNYQPYMNALSRSNPDAVFGALFGGEVATFWKQATAQGFDVPTVFQVGAPTLELIKSADQIPETAYGYIRGSEAVLSKTPVGREVTEVYGEMWADDEHPTPNAWVFNTVSGIQMAKELAEKTGSFDADKWAEEVESGSFEFGSPFAESGTSKVFRNHMTDASVQVGRIIFDGQATYDPQQTTSVYLHDVTDEAELDELSGQ
jgi:branched-chain amino acid transport system substrate-binding protein